MKIIILAILFSVLSFAADKNSENYDTLENRKEFKNGEEIIKFISKQNKLYTSAYIVVVTSILHNGTLDHDARIALSLLNHNCPLYKAREAHYYLKTILPKVINDKDKKAIQSAIKALEHFSTLKSFPSDLGKSK